MEFLTVHLVQDAERRMQAMKNVSIHLAKTIERIRDEATMCESKKRFRELAEAIRQVFWMLDVDRDQLLYISPTVSDIIGESRDEWLKNPKCLRHFVHPDDQTRVDEYFSACDDRGGFDIVYRVVRSDGTERWIHDVACPVRNESGKMRQILGVAEDVTERREVERQIADAATDEQQRLSRDLQDSIGQELTGMTMMAAKVASDLKHVAPDEAKAVEDLSQGLKRTLTQVRRIARGLASVEISAGGLAVALAQLAEQTDLAATSACVFRCGEAFTISDPGVSNHLYRIAQEAVSNAVKHARAQLITVSLRTDGPICELAIEDDGRGFPDLSVPPTAGMGLKSMKYRSDLIGGHFQIGITPSGGTRLSCRVHLNGTSG
ncbi:MAG: PAS domain-containing protein [Planctomycetaceae bacterium]|nr:PAS domain-containing protein [Planctomycetaceae bacterium]